MLRKLYLLAIASFLLCIWGLKAQSVNTNIWDITNKFLVETGERSANANPYPEKIVGKGVLYSFFIIASDGEISDPDFVIPQKEELNYYSFGVMGPHRPMHLLFVKNGTWQIIDMHQTLPDIMNKSSELCELLSLNNEESLYIIKEVIRHYELNDNNKGGASIVFKK